MKKGVTSVAALLLLAGCATQIHPKDQTIQPSKVRLGTFSTVVTKPLVVERMEGDPGDVRAVDRIRAELDQCLGSVFKTVSQVPADRSDFAPGTLVIEPAIEDLKKVNGAERFWVGPMAGSSAILLRVRYTDAGSRDIVASPVFYSKANAQAGTWTFGAADNNMLNRVVTLACSYARSNY